MRSENSYLGSCLAIILLMFSCNVTAVDVINLQGAAAEQALSQMKAKLQQEPNDIDTLKNAGILLHQLNQNKPNQKSVEQSEMYLKKVVESRHEDYEAQAWLGSVITMKALFEKDSGKQTFYVKLGARKMDKAISKVPSNLIVRLIRANNSMELPVFLKRTRYAVTDFEYYLTACKPDKCKDSEIQHALKSLEEAKKMVMDN